MTWIVAIFILLITFAVIWIYNRLVKQRNVVSEAWAGIDVQLQKRAELVPNLVKTVKAYARHESSVLEDVVMARGAVTPGIDNRAEEETALSHSLGRLFALAEDYPELKANESFQQLHTSLVEIEDHLQFARRYYNGAVRDNNNLVESFPANMVAGLFHFKTSRFFEIELVSQRKAPDVDFQPNA